MPDPAPARRPDPIHASAFDSLPAAQVYDVSSWGVSRARGEAGALAGGSAEAPAVLPGVFRLRASDLSDPDEEEEEDDDDFDEHPSTDQHRPEREQHQQPIPQPPPTINNTATSSTTQPSHWRRFLAPRNAGIFCLGPGLTVSHVLPHVRHLLQRRLGAEIVAERPAELRARLRIADAFCTVVVAFDHPGDLVKVAVRRSFADCFRIGAEPFDHFCAQLEQSLRTVISPYP